MRIEEVVLRAVQRLGFADLRPQQMEALKTFMQGKSVCQLDTANR